MSVFCLFRIIDIGDAGGVEREEGPVYAHHHGCEEDKDEIYDIGVIVFQP